MKEAKTSGKKPVAKRRIAGTKAKAFVPYRDKFGFIVLSTPKNPTKK
jgi:hypothetical protein